MKHNLKITLILLVMFFMTQFIGLVVLKADIFHIEKEVNGTVITVANPQLSWIQPPEVETQRQSFSMLASLIIAFIIAISLLFFLTKFKVEFFLKIWFLIVVVIALFLSIYAFEKIAPFMINPYWAIIIPLLIAVPLAFMKIYGRNFLLHNITELFIYPGIAAVFVPILNIRTIVALLIIISVYDMWAVWHSGIMQKMAKYQINKLKVFSGFFVPYISKKVRMQIKKMKKSELKKKKIKVNVAILGGGDIIFPIIAAGVMMKTFPETIIPALFVIAGAGLGLSYLFFFAKKKKFYPAMPYISAGIFLGMGISYLIF